MELNVQERIILSNILNTEGTIAEVSLNLDIYNKIKFSDSENEYLKEKGKQQDFKIESANIAEISVEFSNSEKNRIIDEFEKIGANGKMNMVILPLYRKFKEI